MTAFWAYWLSLKAIAGKMRALVRERLAQRRRARRACS